MSDAEGPRTFFFRKLVRDETVPGFADDASVLAVSHRKLIGVELLEQLIAKIHEEADEIPIAESPDAKARKEIIAEIAGLEDVVAALKQYYGVSNEMTEAASSSKAAKRGRFANGDYIESITVEPGSRWEQYCLDDIDRYPEASGEY